MEDIKIQLLTGELEKHALELLLSFRLQLKF